MGRLREFKPFEVVEIVELAWDREMCPSDCPHLKTFRQGHPYGMGTAYEDLAECTWQLGEETECPKFDEAAKIYVEENPEDEDAEG